MYKYLTPKDFNVLEYFRKNTTLLKLDNSAGLKFNYCDSIQMVEGEDDAPHIQYKLIGAQFYQDGDTQKSKCIGFNQTIEFPLSAKLNMISIDEFKKVNIERKLEKIRIIQTRYPQNMHDYTEYDSLIRDLKEIEERTHIDISAKCYFCNLVVVYQGNILRYGRLQKNKKPNQIKDSHKFELEVVKEEKYLKDIDFIFADDTEIIKLVETADNDVI